MAPRGSSSGGVSTADSGEVRVVAPVGARADALTVLRAIYRDQTADLAKRLDAAKAALPYEHQRKTKDEGGEGVVLNIAIELGHHAS